jgi:flagella basal body P-ring formation protein FlgA
MMRVIIGLCILACPAAAETVVAARTIPPHTTIMLEDIMINSRSIPGGITDPTEIIGMEARVALYAGRPIRPGDLGFPAVVERNQIIPLLYQQNGVVITTEGRALDRAGPGDVIRVMNVSSRSTVTARIGVDGAGYVAR